MAPSLDGFLNPIDESGGGARGILAAAIEARPGGLRRVGELDFAGAAKVIHFDAEFARVRDHIGEIAAVMHRKSFK
ncbi:MAG: hypothetical protein HY854_12925 [Burkholderiales bacterium]|nr:hypothetical protein [Burkholderiales bacterium]